MKKGITFVTMVATIAIMIIITSTIAVAGSNVSNNAKKIAFATEINSLQEATSAYVIKNNGEYPIQDSISLDISKLSAKAKKQFSDNGEVINSDNKILLSKIDYNKIQNNNLKYGNQKNGDNDIYAVSNTTGKVYYAKGIKIASDVYFTLTTDLARLLSFNSSKDMVLSKNAIVFVPSETKWTNTDVTVQVKIPKTYIVSSITANSINVSKDNLASTNDINYDIYNALQTGNYNISVKYKESTSDTEKTSKYNVENVDKVSPNFTLSELTELQYNNSNVAGYINIVANSDDLSGVKKILYENTKIDTNVKEYFQTVSNVVKNNVIPINSGVKNITVYIEDEAGNFNYLSYDINITPTSYVQTNLMVHYDAINNTGHGHDNKTNIWKDLSQNNNDLTVYNTSNTTASGWSKNGLTLDGIDDYFQSAKNVQIDNSYTVEMIFQGFEYQYSTILLGPIQFKWRVLEEKEYFNTFNGSTYYKSNYCIKKGELNVKIAYTFVYDSLKNVIEIYRNGILETKANQTLTAPGIKVVGTEKNSEKPHCSIHSIRIYNKALNSDEIRKNYEYDKVRFE